jgi:hypothetical protein
VQNVKISALPKNRQPLFTYTSPSYTIKFPHFTKSTQFRDPILDRVKTGKLITLKREEQVARIKHTGYCNLIYFDVSEFLISENFSDLAQYKPRTNSPSSAKIQSSLASNQRNYFGRNREHKEVISPVFYRPAYFEL